MNAGHKTPWKIARTYSPKASACCQKYTKAPEDAQSVDGATTGRRAGVAFAHAALGS
jgi:hypothetical protein